MIFELNDTSAGDGEETRLFISYGGADGFTITSNTRGRPNALTIESNSIKFNTNVFGYGMIVPETSVYSAVQKREFCAKYTTNEDGNMYRCFE